jgi:hypothetical protein
MDNGAREATDRGINHPWCEMRLYTSSGVTLRGETRTGPLAIDIQASPVSSPRNHRHAPGYPKKRAGPIAADIACNPPHRHSNDERRVGRAGRQAEYRLKGDEIFIRGSFPRSRRKMVPWPMSLRRRGPSP